MWPLRVAQEQLNFKFNTQAVLGQVFTPAECRLIIDIGTKKFERMPAQTRNGTNTDNNPLEGSGRKGHVSWIGTDEEYHWIYQRCTAAVQQVNYHDWQFDLDNIDTLQFSMYDTLGDHYDWHIDNLLQNSTYRKLSFSIQLSHVNSYDGGDLEFFTGKDPLKAPRDQGSFIAFPSLITHRVTPVTRGQRYSLVGWVNGPKFR